jgi:hypothetical protein
VINTRAKILVLPVLLVVALAPACSAAQLPEGEIVEDPTDPAAAAPSTTKSDPKSDAGPVGTGGQAPADTCPFTGPPIDASIFPKCGDGGRCVPESQIPKDQLSRLAVCPTGRCVAEKIIAGKGMAPLKACKSIGDGEGRCTSIVFPDIEKQKANLPQDVCDANERCAPCFNPLDGKPTGACNMTQCDAATTKGAAFPSCCSDAVGKDRGRCVPKVSLPKEALENLDQKECESTALCAPAEQFVDGFVAPKCTATALLGKYDGACQSTCIKQSFFLQLGTSQGTCAAGSFCAPCKNPLDGTPTGACAP